MYTMQNEPPHGPPPDAPKPGRSRLPTPRSWKRIMAAIICVLAILSLMSAFVANQIAIYAPRLGVKPPDVEGMVGELMRLLVAFVGGG